MMGHDQPEPERGPQIVNTGTSGHTRVGAHKGRPGGEEQVEREGVQTSKKNEGAGKASVDPNVCLPT